MDVYSDYIESAKSILSFDNINYFKAEDSGYHTSFTPGSLECSELSNKYLDQSPVATTAFIDHFQVGYSTPESITRYNQLKPRNENCTDTPQHRRAVKRPHSSAEPTKQTRTIPTPTTWIAGKIQSLEVNEDKENTTTALPPERSSYSTERNARYIYRLNICEQKFSYPITPVKRNCRISPCKKAGKKLDFVIHSLSCEAHELQPLPKHVQVTQTKIKPTQPSLARPDQKIDILSWLNQRGAIPPLQHIFRYLSNEDICNFCSVSTTWNNIWNFHNNDIKKEEIRKYLKSRKENQENCAKGNITKIKGIKYDGCLREIYNEINNNPVKNASNNPQYSPKTNRFRTYMKTASLDPRMQLPCPRCTQPAKVTEESTGEEWAECTSATCSFQFCRFCNCSRHQGKSCVQYDLNAPSPSKRKKCDYAVGTKKSKKNLRRLFL